MPFGINTDKLRNHGKSPSPAPAAASENSQPDIDLVTLLTHPQREDLLHLISLAVEGMRETLLRGFDAPPKKQKQEADADSDKPMTSTPRSFAQGLPQLLTKNDLKMSRLKQSATTSFDQWQQHLLSRILKILNPSDVAKRGGTAAHLQNSLEDTSHAQPQLGGSSGPLPADDVENNHYPPIQTRLTTLPDSVKSLIVQSLLLLILSLETYDARSRTFLRILCTSLHLPPQTLVIIEKSVAATLISTAKLHMSGEEETKAKKEKSAWNRRIKIGIAGVAGAAVIGITGGLAAPFIAAGVGTIMSGIGLGATAAAGYLGALAGSGALRDAQEVEDFAFLPILPSSHPTASDPPSSSPTSSSPAPQNNPYAPPSTSPPHRNPYAPPDTPSSREPTPPPLPSRPVRTSEASKASKTDDANTTTNRLTVTIGISGWITDPKEFETPWHVLNTDSSDIYALRWETTALLDLGSALTTMLKTYAFTYLKIEIIKRTVLASLMAAMWPIALLKIGKVVDNPFNIVKLRAEKAGKILADVLINRAQGGRPVTLVAYSLGARVVYFALAELAERRAFGIVENVYVLGAPTPSGGDDGGDWVAVRGVVSGRMVNVYSEKDYVLGFLYRTSAVQFGVAGLQQVRWPQAVENVDVSEQVEGHLRYRFLVGAIVGKVAGGEMVDWQVVEEERRKAEELKKLEEQMEKEAKEKEESGAEEKELEEAAKAVEEQQAQRHVVRDMAQIRMA
ncbi:hypothetical protein DRE_03249 [Drechslerella stenobrocha 248]|uniref:DUF726-domain-containing protein n=1 Tax=Drechslerella stenobrocha 248 TaxID=1043628 RepID=W7HVT2_9PEZI|nr:hypothetical protein DRE_03249 [Drechslerella stenobrocha 248]